VGALLAAVTAAPAAAQRPAPRTWTPEGRAEAALGREPATLAGAGLLADAGLYARVGVTAAGGVVWADAPGGRQARAAAEVALVGRFLLDPLRQARRGVYAGGGLGMRAAEGRVVRAFLFGLVGVESRASRGVAPALELGVGGGVRVAAVLRRARAGRR
jgi:hypothetical protein